MLSWGFSRGRFNRGRGKMRKKGESGCPGHSGRPLKFASIYGLALLDNKSVR